MGRFFFQVELKFLVLLGVKVLWELQASEGCGDSHLGSRISRDQVGFQGTVETLVPQWRGRTRLNCLTNRSREREHLRELAAVDAGVKKDLELSRPYPRLKAEVPFWFC